MLRHHRNLKNAISSFSLALPFVRRAGIYVRQPRPSHTQKKDGTPLWDSVLLWSWSLRSAGWPRGWLLRVGVAVATALGEDLGGYRAVEAVLEGDGLHGGGGGQRDGGAVEGAAGGRGGAVGGVSDFRAALSGHRHRGALGEGGRAADGGCADGRGAAE